MLGGEEVEVSIWEERWVDAVEHLEAARARRASAFLGEERSAWDRAIVRHLSL